MYVYIYIYIHTYIHTYTRTYTQAHTSRYRVVKAGRQQGFNPELTQTARIADGICHKGGTNINVYRYLSVSIYLSTYLSVYLAIYLTIYIYTYTYT